MYIANPNRYEKMIYKRCGQSGLKLPIISLGLWHNFGDSANYDNMKDIVTTAFDNGITHFDLANNYGPKPGAAEENFGRMMKDFLYPYRDEMIISTKAGYYMWDGPYGDNGSRKYLIASLNQSLKRMNLDYVDIFYHHRLDPETPLEETMGALAQIVRSGKALYVGLSNYDGENLEKATKILTDLNVPFIINQNIYSIFNRNIENNGLKETSYKLNKGIITFSSLAQGLLTDRYIKDIPEDSRIKTNGKTLTENALTPEYFECINKLDDLAKSRNESLATMALRWVLKDDAITSTIVGVSSSKQLLTNLEVIKDNPLTEDQIKLIDECSKNVNIYKR